MGRKVIGLFGPKTVNQFSPVLETAKKIEPGDVVVFNPNTYLVEVWRHGQAGRQVFVQYCPLVSDQRHFEDVAILLGKIAKVSGIASPQFKVPEPFWALQFI